MEWLPTLASAGVTALAALGGGYLGARYRRAERREEQRQRLLERGSGLVAQATLVVDRLVPVALRPLDPNTRKGVVEAARQRWANVRGPLLALGFGHPREDLKDLVFEAEAAVNQALASAEQAAAALLESESLQGVQGVGAMPDVRQVLEALRANPQLLQDTSVRRMPQEHIDELWATVERHQDDAYERLGEVLDALRS